MVAVGAERFVTIKWLLDSEILRGLTPGSPASGVHCDGAARQVHQLLDGMFWTPSPVSARGGYLGPEGRYRLSRKLDWHKELGREEIVLT